MFQKILNRLKLFCIIRHSNCLTKHLMTKNLIELCNLFQLLHVPILDINFRFSHRIHHVSPTVGGVVILTLKKKS